MPNSLIFDVPNSNEIRKTVHLDRIRAEMVERKNSINANKIQFDSILNQIFIWKSVFESPRRNQWPIDWNERIVLKSNSALNIRADRVHNDIYSVNV